MSMYKQNVAQVVSQVAVHLHNALGPIGTALFDRHGTLVFNNNALHYVNEHTLAILVADCLINPAPGGLSTITTEGVTIRTIALDAQHVFVVVGTKLEDNVINGFVSSLRRVLPKASLTDD
jgi:hypothetical protein